jgi:peptide/nickel transport system permease protein
MPMALYVTRRTFHAAIVLLLVLTAVFLSVQLIGDPVRLLLPLTATTEQVEQYRTQIGLNDPLYQQYFDFISGAWHGDFGDSIFFQNQSAFGLALGRVGATFLLAGCSLVIAFVIGVTLGVVAAVKQSSWLGSVISVLSMGAVSLVEFWVALVFIYIFAVELGLVPTSGYGSAANLVLPVAVLCLRPMGRLAQFTRAAVAAELRKPYVRAATARGIPRRRVVGVHALKNVSVPLVTMGGDELIAVVSSAVIIEVVFAWPGVGSLLLQAIQQRDLPLVEACVFIFTLVVVIVNLLVDLTYGALDRRARVI